ncbi:MAG: DUF3303 family protein [Ginsengibacter sp.]
MHPEKRHDALKGFSEMSPDDDKKDMGEQINLIGRWHDLVSSKRVVIYESDNAEAISNWALNWNSVMDFEISVVLDDAETRALGKKRSG